MIIVMEPLREAIGAYQKNTPGRKTSGGIDWRELDYRDRLRKRGYAPNPYCESCKGSGFVHPVDSESKPIFTKVVSCHAEGCLMDSKRAWQRGEGYLKTKGLSIIIKTFDNFDQSVNGTADSYNAFYQLAHEHIPPFLLCYGGTGNGKTHLAEAAVRILNQDGINTHYYTVEGMVQMLKMSIQEDKTDVIVKSLSECHGLVFDDWVLSMVRNGRCPNWSI